MTAGFDHDYDFVDLLVLPTALGIAIVIVVIVLIMAILTITVIIVASTVTAVLAIALVRAIPITTSMCHVFSLVVVLNTYCYSDLYKYHCYHNCCGYQRFYHFFI